MGDVSTGAGEPSRTLALLWRDPGGGRRRGPGRSLTVDAVVEAGLALADAEGLTAVTMRGVAQRVGVSTMSVYTYVPGKAELLDLMVDLLYLRMPRPPWRIRTWRRRLERVAETNRTLFAEHAPGRMTADDRPGAPAENFFYTDNGAEAGLFWHGDRSGWMPASLRRRTPAPGWPTRSSPPAAAGASRSTSTRASQARPPPRSPPATPR